VKEGAGVIHILDLTCGIETIKRESNSLVPFYYFIILLLKFRHMQAECYNFMSAPLITLSTLANEIIYFRPPLGKRFSLRSIHEMGYLVFLPCSAKIVQQ